MKFYRVVCLLALLPMLLAGQALAQDDPKARARELFNTAVSAYEEQRFDEASQKFEQAYALSPAYAVLYNIGQVNAALGRPVEAVAAYEKYLSQGGAQIAKDRQVEVRRELERQRARIGSLMLRLTPTTASIQIDGRTVALGSSSEPLLLVAGSHSVVAYLDGYSTVTREVPVQARSQIELEISLVPSSPSVTAPAAAAPAVTAPTPALAPTVVISPLTMPPAPARPFTHSSAGTLQRVIGYALGGIGLVGGGTGAYFAAKAASDVTATKNRMGAPGVTQSDYDAAKVDHDDAISHNRVGWIVAGAGGALFLGGIILIATAPSGETQSALWVAPFTTGSAFGASARAIW